MLKMLFLVSVVVIVVVIITIIIITIISITILLLLIIIILLVILLCFTYRLGLGLYRLQNFGPQAHILSKLAEAKAGVVSFFVY